ncbi:MAG: rod shape-determining protein MreC [Paludibacteraceae bacterium]
MRNLFNFLARNSVIFLFVFLEIIALILLSSNKGYQRSVMLSSANSVVGKAYDWSNSFVEFFKLKEANESLSNENTELQNKIVELQNKLNAVADSTNSKIWKTGRISPENQYQYTSAKVIRITTDKLSNYITINKGSNEGIAPDMGVVSDEGVVGIVKTVSPRLAVVIPVLNPRIQVSSKFKKTNYTGPLVWNGEDYRYSYLQDIARHVKFNLGDTLVTSGLTPSFPEGIVIGSINDFKIKESDAYYKIQVKLAVNFRTLTHVKVIKYQNYQEQISLEQKAEKEDEN